MKSEELAVGLFFGILVGILSATLIVHEVLTNIWEKDLIQRGYAIHCPVDGAFAFKGECGK